MTASVKSGYPDLRQNHELSLATLAAAAAGATVDFDNPRADGAQIYINVTALGGAPTNVTFTIQGKDPVTGSYYTILAGAAITSAGNQVLRVFPGAPATANVSANDFLPRTWRISWAFTGGTAPTVTATIGAQMKVAGAVN